MVNSVAQETHADVAVSSAAKPGVVSKRKASRVFLYNLVSFFVALFGMVFAFLRDVVWPKLCKNVFAPAAIFVLAVFSAVAKFLTERKHGMMCTCHQLVAKIARARAQRLTGIALLTAIVVFLFSSAFYSFGIEVIIDGESLGYVISQEDYNNTLARVQTRVSQIMGKPHTVSPNVAFSFGIVARDKILEGEKLEGAVYSQIEGIEQLYAVSVDGKTVGACNTEEGAKQAIALLTASDNTNIKRQLLTDVKISFGSKFPQK